MVQENLGINEPQTSNEWIPPLDTPLCPKPYFQPEYLKGNNDAANAVLEIKALWDYVIKDALHNYSVIYSQLSIPLSYEMEQICRKHKESFAVYDIQEKGWLFKPSELNYMYCYDGEDFIDFTDAKAGIPGEGTGNRLLLVGKYTTLMQESHLLEETAAITSQRLEEFIMPYVELIVGVPGCGKTSYIIKNHRCGSLVLTSCAEGAQDIRERMAEKCSGQPRDYRWSYRTIDSYLLHSRGMFFEVWVDEALMEHPGKLFLVCAFSGCSRLCLLGDPNQLGYINRNEITLKYDKSAMFFTPNQTLNVSYRCPVDVMAILSKNFNYSGGAYSASSVLRSLRCETFTTLKDVPQSAETKYLVWKQAEKRQLRAAGLAASTVHEFQGKQAARVALVRTARRARDPLHDSAPHLLVALSRHTHSLVYYTPVTDKLKQIIDVPFTDAELKEYQRLTPQTLLPEAGPIISPFAISTAKTDGNKLKQTIEVPFTNADFEEHQTLNPQTSLLPEAGSIISPLTIDVKTESKTELSNNYYDATTCSDISSTSSFQALCCRDKPGTEPNDDKPSNQSPIKQIIEIITDNFMGFLNNHF